MLFSNINNYCMLTQQTFVIYGFMVDFSDRSQSDAINWKSRTSELKNRRSCYLQDATHV